jgi:small-conductance mechanosensitive channel/CRP-like cAMP-binding protein
VTPTLIPAAALVAIAIVGVLVLRRLPDVVRLAFDIVCFSAIGAYLLKEGVAPIFPPLNEPIDSRALWLRAAAGAWWLLGARIVVYGLRFALHRDRRSREARLFSDLSAAVIYIATAAIVLSFVFALPVTGIVATSGVAAIVLALALQNTLADVFAGIAVGVEAPFRVGDRILIGDKTEGQVVQVNWRSIRIQTDGDDVVTVPNSLVAKAEIVNRTYPLKRTASSVDISCPADAPPERVIETMLDATLLCPRILRSPSPSAFLVRLGPTRNVYRILFTLESATQLASTKDMLLRAARRQLHCAGFLERDHQQPATAGAARSPSMAQRLLGDMVLFESLDQEQIDGLAGQLKLKRIEPGEILFAQGVEDGAMYVVASGVLEVSRQVDAFSETIGCIGAGEYLGEISLLTGAPHAATATARTHCQIYRLPREAIEPLLSQNEVLAASLDRSVRKGLEILHRDVAVRAAPSIGQHGQLLMLIRSMFHVGRAESAPGE